MSKHGSVDWFLLPVWQSRRFHLHRRHEIVCLCWSVVSDLSWKEEKMRDVFSLSAALLTNSQGKKKRECNIEQRRGYQGQGQVKGKIKLGSIEDFLSPLLHFFRLNGCLVRREKKDGNWPVLWPFFPDLSTFLSLSHLVHSSSFFALIVFCQAILVAISHSLPIWSPSGNVGALLLSGQNFFLSFLSMWCPLPLAASKCGWWRSQNRLHSCHCDPFFASNSLGYLMNTNSRILSSKKWKGHSTKEKSGWGRGGRRRRRRRLLKKASFFSA